MIALRAISYRSSPYHAPKLRRRRRIIAFDAYFAKVRLRAAASISLSAVNNIYRLFVYFLSELVERAR